MAELDNLNEIEEFKKLVTQFFEFTDDVFSKQQRIQKDQALESKFKREMKINKELLRKLSVLQKKDAKYENICNLMMSSLSITDSDKQRLQMAKQIIEIAKQYTGIRWDFSAQMEFPRMYPFDDIKNRSKMMLESFDYNKKELSHTVVVDKLWKLIETSSTVDWNDLVIGKESS